MDFTITSFLRLYCWYFSQKYLSKIISQNSIYLKNSVVINIPILFLVLNLNTIIIRKQDILCFILLNSHFYLSLILSQSLNKNIFRRFIYISLSCAHKFNDYFYMHLLKQLNYHTHVNTIIITILMVLCTAQVGCGLNHFSSLHKLKLKNLRYISNYYYIDTKVNKINE